MQFESIPIPTEEYWLEDKLYNLREQAQRLGLTVRLVGQLFVVEHMTTGVCLLRVVAEEGGDKAVWYFLTGWAACSGSRE